MNCDFDKGIFVEQFDYLLVKSFLNGAILRCLMAQNEAARLLKTMDPKLVISPSNG